MEQMLGAGAIHPSLMPINWTEVLASTKQLFKKKTRLGALTLPTGQLDRGRNFNPSNQLDALHPANSDVEIFVEILPNRHNLIYLGPRNRCIFDELWLKAGERKVFIPLLFDDLFTVYSAKLALPPAILV